MIIRNIFGNEPVKKAASKAKFCGICQEAMQKEKGDNVKLEHCAECIITDKISQAAYWKSAIALKKVNSLSPDMESLKQKLAQNRDLVDGSFKRLSAKATPSSSLKEVRAGQSKEVSLEVVRNQVAEMLPSVLHEYGLLGKVNAELVLDAIVPTKIASPIADSTIGRSILRNIVAETVGFFDSSRIASKEASVRAHNPTQAPGDITSILNEGFQRISNKTGPGTRSRTIKATAFDPMEGPEDAGYAPPENDDPADNESKVVHLPDEQAMEILHDKANPEMPEDPQGDPAMDGMDPQMGQGGPPPDMLNEGIGGPQAAENMVPSSDEMDEMPGQSAVNRVQSASSRSDLMARRLSNMKVAKPKFSDFQHFSFAGKLNSKPVEIVKLASDQKYVIDHSEPSNYYTAAYSDGTKKTFKCYATDKGALFVNDEFVVHASSGQAFEDFIETDRTFTRWAFLPPHVDVKEEIMSPQGMDEMALPGMGDDEMGMGGDDAGSPGFNEVKETHLNSSPDNSIPGGMAADEEALFNNGDPGVGGPTLAGNDDAQGAENELLDTATHLMPQVEEMFPDESPQTHQEMAIEAALNILEAKYKVG